MNQLVGRLACCASLSLALVACDKGAGEKKGAEASGGAKPAPGNEGGGDREPDPKPDAEPGEENAGSGEAKLKKNSFTLPSKEEAEKAKESYKAHLAAGRKAVKAKDYAAGVTQLRLAKEQNPASPKVLGELGWALFLDGKYDAAEVELKLALRHVKEDKTRGAVLYNLGRVEEARDNQAMAAEYYGQSLDRRPNDTVKARLDALGGSEESEHAACVFEKRTGAVPDNLCQSLLADIVPDDPEDPPSCEYDTSAGSLGPGEKTVFMIEEPDFRATVFSVWNRDMYEERFMLAVVSGKEWWVGELAAVSHPGAGYADENVDEISLEVEDLVTGGKKELIVSWTVSGHDMDPGIEWMEDYHHSNVAVVSLDSGAPAWMATVRVDALSHSGDMDPEEWGATIDGHERAWVAIHDFEDGSVIVTKDPAAPFPESSPGGTYKLGSYPVLCPSEQDYFGL